MPRSSGQSNVKLAIILLFSFVVVFWNVAAFTGRASRPRVPLGYTKAAQIKLDTDKDTPLFYANGQRVDVDDDKAWKQKDITWFTILNGPRYYWCQTIESAWHNGITMNLWGWGNTEFNDWLKTWMKIPLAIEFSIGLDKGDMMGFVDGADSLFQKSNSEIMELYDNAKAPSHHFLMSSEINCAVQSLPFHGCNNTRFPITPWGLRYLNSGLYLGPADKLRYFLQWVEKVYLPRYANGTVQRNDQSVIGKAYHDGWNQNMTLDSSNILFQSVRMAEGQYCQEGGDSKKLPVPDPVTKKLKNCLTDSSPGVFHFNGKAKPFLGNWITKFWWYGKTINPDAVVFVNKKPVSLKAICPKLNYG
eukprot:TRINITY_DN31041_c0_g1_i1.p1 TRINITY_DN31041_c0_g1~~TRINITY_DN31041_c0_g1_i1.p1  ORF type:complete len:360 (+),score=40.21 TRINITY_DN31041_c0_g1_i1:42-1121(+)